jgi:diguanylate cyclase (GGDEF)-like protein
VQVWRQGFVPAAWYLCGQALLFLSALAVVGVNWGLLDAPFVLANGLQIGVVAEMLVFAYALSARVRLMRQRQSELRREADDLAEAVATDALTGLANRVGLSRRAQQLHAEAQAHAVMLLDLDRFKPVNDTHGHEVGDRLLIEVARRLQTQMREGDLVARLGGDEFVILLGGHHTPAQLAALAQRLCDAVRQPLLHAGHLITVDASIGIARCPEHGQTLTELLRHADAAMYRAKQAHSGFAFYEPASASA